MKAHMHAGFMVSTSADGIASAPGIPTASGRYENALITHYIKIVFELGLNRQESNIQW
jgi:hypothetical protein